MQNAKGMAFCIFCGIEIRLAVRSRRTCGCPQTWRYVKELKGKGIKAEMRAKGSMTRVLVPGFKSSDEAYSYARQIRMQSEEFESAWVLKL